MNQTLSDKKKKTKKQLTVKIYKKQTGAKVSEELRERNKENNKIKKIIFGALESGPKTVPEIANETGVPSHKILWHIATSLRYRLVEPVEKTDEDYWKYQLAEKEK